MSSVAAGENTKRALRLRPRTGRLAGTPLRPFGGRRTFGRAASAAVVDLIRFGDASAPFLAGVLASGMTAPAAAVAPEAVLTAALTALTAAVLWLLRSGPEHPASSAAQVLERSAVGLLSALLVADVLPAAPPPVWWALYGGALIAAFTGLRLAALALCAWCERTGRFRDVFAVVGSGEAPRALVRALAALPPTRSETVGLFRPAGAERGEATEFEAGSLEDLLKGAPGWGVTHVILVASEPERESMEASAHLCLRLAVELRHYPGAGAPPTREGEGAPRSALDSLRVSPPLMSFWRSFTKRALDLGLGLLLLLFLSPLMLAIAAAIRLESPGPAIFRQRRWGFNNAKISVYKFRTMWAHAEDLAGSRQTEINDPRVTRIGRFLRASSLDELPQLLNVLRGDMSLVGPRPHPLGMRVAGALCEDILPTYLHRHRVKPGLTGLAQIAGCRGPVRDVSALSQRLAHDLDYIAAGSIRLDLKILALTPIRLIACGATSPSEGPAVRPSGPASSTAGGRRRQRGRPIGPGAGGTP